MHTQICMHQQRGAWRDKEETQSIISVMIRDLLWAELPEIYDVAIADYWQQIYEYVYNAYPVA